MVPTAGRHVSGIPPATRASLRPSSGAESAQAVAATAATSSCSATTSWSLHFISRAEPAQAATPPPESTATPPQPAATPSETEPATAPS